MPHSWRVLVHAFEPPQVHADVPRNPSPAASLGEQVMARPYHGAPHQPRCHPLLHKQQHAIPQCWTETHCPRKPVNILRNTRAHHIGSVQLAHCNSLVYLPRMVKGATVKRNESSLIVHVVRITAVEVKHLVRAQVRSLQILHIDQHAHVVLTAEQDGFLQCRNADLSRGVGRKGALPQLKQRQLIDAARRRDVAEVAVGDGIEKKDDFIVFGEASIAFDTATSGHGRVPECLQRVLQRARHTTAATVPEHDAAPHEPRRAHRQLNVPQVRPPQRRPDATQKKY
ncbi:hypothetical protein, conserved [Leishmania tarentolae]|uniref:Uncharacterized protein n=1 Tax=Leishmania tarentolae TaxID=5689 RepID=A0A640KIM9_LEITA|nr:hypothetical protein, conserved [Leishmania tarentolae]